MNDENVRWEYWLSKEKFDTIRSDERFTTILTLARVVNSLMFCNQVMLESMNGDKPSDSRQRINSLLFASGVLFEGLQMAKSLGKYFRERAAYQNGFRRILGDARTLKLERDGGLINRARNHVTFHFNRDAIHQTLPTLDFESYAFVTGHGSQNGQSYFQLADEVVLNYIIGDVGSKEAETEAFKELLGDMIAIVTEYIDAANDLILDVIVDLGWVGRIHEEPE
jgi:hypothetical protein